MFPELSGVKLEINNRKKIGEFTDTWKFEQHTSKQQMEIRKYFERNENTKYQTLRDAPKTVHRGKFLV